eukprot:SM002896S10420  [mRNA]  locus=s2896:17:1164:- [translate_table: standard]
MATSRRLSSFSGPCFASFPPLTAVPRPLSPPAPFDPNAQVDHLESVLAIHRVLAQIQQLERAVVAPTAATDAALRVESLTKWLQEQGLQAEGLRLEAGLPEGGAGVIAARTLRAGELIAVEDVGLLCEHDSWLRAMPSLILSLHLLFEKVLLPPPPTSPFPPSFCPPMAGHLP